MSSQQIIDQAIVSFDKSLQFLSNEFARLQVGRASPNLVETIKAEAYGATQPLKNLASISIPDPKSIKIDPWDKSLINGIQKAILEANIGLTPTNMGACLLLNIPPLTEERRKDLVKVVHKMTEDAKIGIRQARQDCISKLKEMKNNSEIAEDELKGAEDRLQIRVDEFNQKVEDLKKKKEQEVMTV
ncbi:MAG: ribosome recycling factor, ribosome recycling factor [Candidatus Peregrinibacteria bacterium GW2011_GWF2_33_10]|nr:MAG: ribosome recycling factor, ribosome recycling factor [Candidatus Peregrinibacteria bacterium GW2011_GWF2_33_10]OGJ45142.1 MAG: ribosome recycling factor [Candidatus Peregrinibacteria bacterium RIFOXYA2_FULL_33_21]OGJ46329.1 MAG: ribosome recycling factor [Candidatus Peregrinibacteria bacterium RIFOXYA12_FULL_33_12]OGJ50811.1 MAG: ribosome recycling factor [Candidatus Peregrinibacteria bacterium RIFOXYB2_FULL_33_20]